MNPTPTFDYKLMQVLLREVGEINDVLHHHRVNAGVMFNDVQITSTYIRYRITLNKGVRVSRVTKLKNELIDRLSRSRGQTTDIRINEAPLVLEVPHPSPSIIKYIDSHLIAPKYSMVIGQSDENLRTEDVTIDLTKKPHTLIAAETGGGKSVLMTGAILSLAENNHPDDLVIHLIDFKNDNLLPLKDLPHVDGHAYEAEAATRMLTKLQAIMDLRISGDDTSKTKHLLCVDEILEAVKHYPQIKAIIERFTALGRSNGMHVFAATQHPLASEIGSIIKANFTTRIVGKVTSSEASKLAAGISKVGAESLPGAGSFILVDGGKRTRLQSYFVEGDETEAVVASIIQRYGSKEDFGEDRLSSELDKYLALRQQHGRTIGHYSTDVVEYATMPTVQELFVDYYDRDLGEMRRGYQDRMTKAIFGEKAYKGGWMRKKVLDVVDLLRENLHLVDDLYED